MTPNQMAAQKIVSLCQEAMADSENKDGGGNLRLTLSSIIGYASQIEQHYVGIQVRERELRRGDRTIELRE